jgi:rfaE bifunctional protein nucleotidyltransferase chain/domain
MARHMRATNDSVFSARAIFIPEDRLARATAADRRLLETLSRSFRIEAAPPEPDALLRLAEENGMELHASWLIGGAPDLGFRGVLDASLAPSLGAALRTIQRADARSRIISDPERLERLGETLHQRGARVVFTNGVFDLLHVGHLRLLEQAKALGKVLIVGINSDDSTRAIKGPGRPVVPQFARARLLADLRFVDYCFIFTDADPIPTLELLRPDVLVKGQDYAGNQVVGARLVAGYGGRVVRLPIVRGSSTTATIKAISGTALRALPRTTRQSTSARTARPRG